MTQREFNYKKLIIFLCMFFGGFFLALIADAEGWGIQHHAPEPVIKALHEIGVFIGVTGLLTIIHELALKHDERKLILEEVSRTVTQEVLSEMRGIRALVMKMGSHAIPADGPAAAKESEVEAAEKRLEEIKRLRAAEPFVDREADIQEIKNLIKANPSVSLTGAPGVGKTALAVEVALDLAHEYRGGACLVRLGSVTKPMQALREIARALGIREEPVKEKLLAFLRSREMLLVLDKCEHMVEAPEFVAYLESLQGPCDGLRIMLTSHQKIGLSHEMEYPLESLDIPPGNVSIMEQLVDYPAAKLFVQRIKQARNLRVLSLKPQEIAEAAVICRRVDGNPGVIEWIARWAKTRSITEIHADLGELLNNKKNVVWEYLSLTYHDENRLSASERSLLERLSAFADDFDRTAIKALCPDWAESSTARQSLDALLDKLLSSLIDKWLVSVVRQADGTDGRREAGGPADIQAVKNGDGGNYSLPRAQTRYRLRGVVREFAVEQSAQNKNAAEVRDWHATYFERLVHTSCCNEMLTAKEQRSLQHLEQERMNIHAALDWFISGKKWGRAYGMARDLVRFWWLNGHLGEGRDYMDRLRQAQPPQEQAQDCGWLTGAGIMAYFGGEYAKASEYSQRAYDLAKELGDEPAQAMSECVLAGISARNAAIALNDSTRVTEKAGRKKLEKAARAHLYTAVKQYRAVLKVSERLRQDSWISVAKAHLGFIEAYGNLGKGYTMCSEAYELVREGGNDWVVMVSATLLAIVKTMMAQSAREKGQAAQAEMELDQAFPLYDKALNISTQFPGKVGVVETIECLAGFWLSKGETMCAARLLAWAENRRVNSRDLPPRPALLERYYQETRRVVRDKLSREEFDDAAQQGVKLPLAEAVEEALGKRGGRASLVRAA